MSWNVFITNLSSAFLLPPLDFVVLCAAGFLLRKRWPRFGTNLSFLSLFALVMLSTPVGAMLIVRPLEDMSPPLASARDTGAQAIVVLSGGQMLAAPEYGGSGVPNATSLIRLRYAAKLHTETGLPILVSGGAPTGAPGSEAAQMARVLREEFLTPVKWLEEASNNTAQNAQFSARILQPVGVQKILLVTDALHMARAKSIFVRNGFDVIAAPTRFFGKQPLTWFDLIPTTHALDHARFAMHEWIGMVWYRMHY